MPRKQDDWHDEVSINLVAERGKSQLSKWSKCCHVGTTVCLPHRRKQPWWSFYELAELHKEENCSSRNYQNAVTSPPQQYDRGLPLLIGWYISAVSQINDLIGFLASASPSPPGCDDNPCYMWGFSLSPRPSTQHLRQSGVIAKDVCKMFVLRTRRRKLLIFFALFIAPCAHIFFFVLSSCYYFS